MHVHSLLDQTHAAPCQGCCERGCGPLLPFVTTLDHDQQNQVRVVDASRCPRSAVFVGFGSLTRRGALPTANTICFSICAHVCAQRPGLPRSCHSGELACLPCKEGAALTSPATLAAAPVLFAHAFVQCHMEKPDPRWLAGGAFRGPVPASFCFL